MATLFELKDEILKGRAVKRSGWINYYNHYELTQVQMESGLFADDWELKPLPKKKIKLYGYVSTFGVVHLLRESQLGDDWLKAPNLDQEIEVDE